MEITPGSRLTVHPALFGAASFRSSESGRVLDVYMDGVYIGTTPLALPQVVVGRHLVRFGGPGLTTSAQEVEILPGVEDIAAIDQHVAGRALSGIEVIDPVDHAQQGGFAASRGSDEGGDRLVG